MKAENINECEDLLDLITLYNLIDRKIYKIQKNRGDLLNEFYEINIFIVKEISIRKNQIVIIGYDDNDNLNTANIIDFKMYWFFNYEDANKKLGENNNEN